MFPEESKLIGPVKINLYFWYFSIFKHLPVKIFLNIVANDGTCEAACEHPTTSIKDFDTGALTKEEIKF